MNDETFKCCNYVAGGLGKRMNSDLPKVLHNVGEVPMLVRVINQVKKLNLKIFMLL